MENSVVKSLRDKITEQKKVIDDLQKTYRVELQKNLDAIIRDFFQATPEIQCVHWTQYTPYWNDGDECYFAVNDIVYEPAGTDPDDYDPYDSGANFNEPRSIAEIEAEIETVKNIPAGQDLVEDSEIYVKYKNALFTVQWDAVARKYVHRLTVDESYREDFLEALEKELELAKRASELGWDTTRALQNFKEFKNFIEDIDNETMESVFGNHVQVFLTIDGIETEEYGHD